MRTSPKRPVTKTVKKKKMFVAEYTIDYNATQAAIRAGYSERTA
jgi:phage terminase small subunit